MKKYEFGNLRLGDKVIIKQRKATFIQELNKKLGIFVFDDTGRKVCKSYQQIWWKDEGIL